METLFKLLKAVNMSLPAIIFVVGGTCVFWFFLRYPFEDWKHLWLDIFLLIITSFALASLTYEQYHTITLTEIGEETVGTIIKIENTGTEAGISIFYQYEVQGSIFRREEGNRGKNLKVGEKYKVLYHPQKPKKAMILLDCPVV